MSLTCRQIADQIEKFAPLALAEEWDKVGFQCGDPFSEARAVVVALDARMETIEYAIQSGAGMLVCHHPLIFQPLKMIDPRGFPGRELTALIRHDIALYAAHTNVDLSPNLSMNATIGRLLGLSDAAPMAASFQEPGYKLTSFVPLEALDALRQSLAEAGAGRIGEYDCCSFTVTGTGTFRGGEASHPTIGMRGQLERIEEARIEMLCSGKHLDAVLKALRQSHPYEEMAYDIHPLAGYRNEAQFLWKGAFEIPLTLRELALMVGEKLGDSQSAVRFAGDGNKPVQRVAWCSGSGKSLLRHLSSKEVDVFITGDMDHHHALEFLSKGIAVIDIDHFQTEKFFITNLVECLSSRFPTEEVRFLADDCGPVFHGAR